MPDPLPSRPPLRCRLHIHEWIDWYRAPIHHQSQWSWDTWQHICTGLQKTCMLCGTSRRHRRHGSCYGNVWVVLRPRPYIPSESELEVINDFLRKQVSGSSSR